MRMWRQGSKNICIVSLAIFALTKATPIDQYCCYLAIWSQRYVILTAIITTHNYRCLIIQWLNLRPPSCHSCVMQFSLGWYSDVAIVIFGFGICVAQRNMIRSPIFFGVTVSWRVFEHAKRRLKKHQCSLLCHSLQAQFIYVGRSHLLHTPWFWPDAQGVWPSSQEHLL